ncbi:MAG: class I SAM-dependent methyltransferase [Acidimicrobiales bacterium]
MSASELASDLAGALRQGAGFGHQELLERRRRRSQPFEFTAIESQATAIEGWLPPAEAEALFTLARSARSGTAIVEIGSYLGKSTVFLAAGARLSGAHVYAVDPHTGDRSFVERLGLSGIDTAPAFRANLSHAGVSDQVTPMVTTSAEAARAWEQGRCISLLFVDGWHSTEAVIEDARSWAPHLADDAVVVFDDRGDPEVAAGIGWLVEGGHLPAHAGDTGKMSVFAPPSLFQRVPRLRRIVRSRRWRTPDA